MQLRILSFVGRGSPPPDSDIFPVVQKMDRLILASSSPRRAEILTHLCIPFVVDAPRVEEEILPGETAERAAARLADQKAAEVALRHPASWVLAADTLVVLDGAILGKPRDEQDARRMLRLLSGRRHRVVTGVRLRRGAERGWGLVEESLVTVAPLSEEELTWYVATGEPRDKAGAYAVQGLGARFIEAVEGSFTNVMGLPARGVYRLMRDARVSALGLLALSSP
jgi:septum formation protein